MKPRRIQRDIGPSWQGNIPNTGEKPTLSQAKPSSCASRPVEVTPFAGKVFYLDLPSNRTTQTLESDIKELGGTVEKFFSKEIKYLVSNKREARYVQCLRQDSPVPSPESGPSSPQPGSNPHQPASHGDVKSRFHGQTNTFSTSRGKSLVKRVVKEQERVQMNKILSNALEWGVKILYVDDVIKYVQKKKRILSSQCPATTMVKTNVKAKAESPAKHGFQKCKGEPISKPFVKVEDSSRRYRPIYLNMPNMPEFNLKTVPPCTPFCVDKKDQQHGRRGESDKRTNGQKKNKDKKQQGGFCECCMIKYDNLTTHLQSKRHKAYSKTDAKYLVVDRLVSAMRCNFIHIKPQMKRPKCSASSVVIAPGPCGKTKPKHKGDGDTTEIIKEEQLTHQTDERHGKYYLTRALKITSDSGPAPLNHRKGDRRNHRSYANMSKHRSLARKQPCRQNWTLRYQAEQDQMPQPMEETAASRGCCVASDEAFPPGVTQADLLGQKCHTNINSSTAHSHNMNIQREASSERFNVITKQEESQKRQESSPCDTVQGGNEKMTENSLVEKETQGFSPVRKIQRRIRVYKRKRRKVDAQVVCGDHVQLSDSADNGLLKLWRLFQSSDDMDVEFLGFED